MVVKTREKLIDVARQLFAHKGVEHTTMNDIANASDKGRRTIYTYFKNKREIYDAVIESESDRIVTTLREIVKSDAPVETRLRQLMLKRLEYTAPQQSSYLSIKMLLKLDFGRMERIRKSVVEKEKTLFNELLAEGVSVGVFRKDRCEKLSQFVISCMQAIEMTDTDNYQYPVSSEARVAFIDFIISDICIKQPDDENTHTIENL